MDSARPCSTASAALHGGRGAITSGSEMDRREPTLTRPPRPLHVLRLGKGGPNPPPPYSPHPPQSPALPTPSPKPYVLARWVVKTYTNCDGGFPGTPPPPPPGTSGRRPGGGPCGGPAALLSLRGSWAVWPGPSCGAAMAGSATLQSASREKKDSK